MASHGEEECPGLNSTDDSSTQHAVTYAHQEPGSSSSTVPLMAKEKKQRKTSVSLYSYLTFFPGSFTGLSHLVFLDAKRKAGCPMEEKMNERAIETNKNPPKQSCPCTQEAFKVWEK